MAILLSNPSAPSLSPEISQAIQRGVVRGWMTVDGDFLTMSASKYRAQAYFKEIRKGEATFFGIIKPKTKIVTREVYVIYHTKFLELLLTHFKSAFTSAEVTSHPLGVDLIR